MVANGSHPFMTINHHVLFDDTTKTLVALATP
jgi:hypothetical protein